MNKRMKASIGLGLSGLLLAGCAQFPSGTVTGKMIVPAYYTNTGKHVPTCWEILVSGINGGSTCVSKAVYKATKIGSSWN